MDYDELVKRAEAKYQPGRETMAEEWDIFCGRLGMTALFHTAIGVVGALRRNRHPEAFVAEQLPLEGFTIQSRRTMPFRQIVVSREGRTITLRRPLRGDSRVEAVPLIQDGDEMGRIHAWAVDLAGWLTDQLVRPE